MFLVQANGRKNSSTENPSFSPSFHPNKVGGGNISPQYPKQRSKDQNAGKSSYPQWHLMPFSLGWTLFPSSCAPSIFCSRWAGQEQSIQPTNSVPQSRTVCVAMGTAPCANPWVTDQVALAPMSFHTKCLLSLHVSPYAIHIHACALSALLLQRCWLGLSPPNL